MQLLNRNITENCREVILKVMVRCVIQMIELIFFFFLEMFICECRYPLVIFCFQLNANLILFSLKPWILTFTLSFLVIIQGTGVLLNGVRAAVPQRLLQEQLQQHCQCQQWRGAAGWSRRHHGLPHHRGWQPAGWGRCLTRYDVWTPCMFCPLVQKPF